MQGGYHDVLGLDFRVSYAHFRIDMRCLPLPFVLLPALYSCTQEYAILSISSWPFLIRMVQIVSNYRKLALSHSSKSERCGTFCEMQASKSNDGRAEVEKVLLGTAALRLGVGLHLSAHKCQVGRGGAGEERAASRSCPLPSRLSSMGKAKHQCMPDLASCTAPLSLRRSAFGLDPDSNCWSF
jgi:hypothetical protein